jgi:flagellar biosynthesis anti-sigma factor FlgM
MNYRGGFMKIYNNNYYNKNIYTDNLVDSNNKKLSNNEKDTTSGNVDRVELSTAGKKLKLYTDKIQQLDEARISEIENIKSKIQNGEYSVSTEELAGKIIEKLSLDTIVQEDE